MPTDTPLSKDERLRDMPSLTVDAMTVSVDLKCQTVDVSTHSRAGNAFLLINEARDLRDWLIKVLP